MSLKKPEPRSTPKDNATGFAPLNRAFNSCFRKGALSLGLVVPIEAHGANPVPDMEHHIARAQLADELGFAALWLRDVPFNVPSFGDAGVNFLKAHLTELQTEGINHVALNLRFNQAPINDTLNRLADTLLPAFPTGQIDI